MRAIFNLVHVKLFLIVLPETANIGAIGEPIHLFLKCFERVESERPIGSGHCVQEILIVRS